MRFVCELQTFEYNKVTRKAQAQKGKHDDAIMAMCIALYVRDTLLRDLPMGAERPKESVQIIKNAVYEEIKKQLLEGSPEDLLADDEIDILAPEKDSYYGGYTYIPERKYDKLLREFGF
jgi:hypothetical protein